MLILHSTSIVEMTSSLPSPIERSRVKRGLASMAPSGLGPFTSCFFSLRRHDDCISFFDLSKSQREIKKLEDKVAQKGMTVVPLKIFFNDNNR